MLFLTLQYVLSPYKRTLDGRLAMFANIGLVLVYLATLTLNSCSMLETDTQTCGDEFGLSQLGLSYMFLSFSTALLGVGVLLVAWLVYTAPIRICPPPSPPPPLPPPRVAVGAPPASREGITAL